MSAIVTGLKAVSEKMEERNSGKAKWLQLKDGEGVTIQFISEIDPDSSFYDQDRGLAIAVAEHTNPKNFKRKAVCTRGTEGRCIGCEMAQAHPKTGWASKIKMYFNILVTPKKEDPYVAIWSISVNEKSTSFQTLKSYFEDNGHISGTTWSLKRSGKDFNNTTYTLLPSTKAVEKDLSEYEIYDLAKTAIREKTYDEQYAFYFDEDSAEPSEDVKETELTTTW